MHPACGPCRFCTRDARLPHTDGSGAHWRYRTAAERRSQAHACPLAGRAREQETVVQAGRTPLPEFQAVGHKPVAAPVGGARRCRIAGKTLSGLRQPLVERCASGYRLALRGGPGPEARFDRAFGKVRIRFGSGDRVDASANAYLALELGPEEKQAGVRISRQFAAFFAGIVREEDETPGVELLAQDDAHARAARRIDRCQRHRVGIAPARLYGVLEPALEQRVGIAAGVILLEGRE